LKETTERQTEELEAREKYYNRHKIEWHRKFFLAVVCFVLFFIGAPLGAIIRKGGIGLPTLIALAFFILYQLLTMVGENLAKKGFIEPWIGMWMSTLVLLPISIWLTYKATKEAALLDPDRYKRAIQKLLTYFKPKSKKLEV
jgi:lipopolysaccharide export system permease protein